ncbi:MAG: O-antigen ligase family protein [Bdellovibrionales bacterium]|nr:O-antigen ligase family protein [Bdellovibrionales bacterium]
MEPSETKNAFEQLLISFLFLLIPLGVSFWTVTGTLDQFTEFRWLILYGVCILLLAGSFFTRFEIRVPKYRQNGLFYFFSGGLTLFCGIATFGNLPGQLELQLLEWFCFIILFLWSFTLSAEEHSRALLWRSIRFANRLGLLGVGLYLVAQSTGHPWRYLASYSGHLGSLFGHKNYAAAFYAIALLIELTGFQKNRKRMDLAFSGFLILLGLYGFYCAKARGATLGFGFGILMLLWQRVGWKGRLKWILAFLLLASACYVAAVLSYRGMENGSNTRDLRIARWLNTGAMMWDHPLGIGPGHYEYDYLRYTSRVRKDAEIDGRFVSKTPHNQPLQIGVDYGMPALVFWILLTGWILRLAVRTKAPEGAILVCILVDGLFAFPLHVTHSFLAYAVFCGILLGRELESHPLPVKSPLPFLKGAVVGGMSWVAYAIFASVMAESYDINHYESMKKACDLAPWRFKNCSYLAKIEGNMGNFEDGINTCRLMLRRQPNGFPAYEILSELYRLSGNHQSRCDSLESYNDILGKNSPLLSDIPAECSSGSQ